MKKCPSCSRYYDHSQSFCLEDGTPLVSEPEAETLVLPPSSRQKKSKLPLIILGLLVLFGGVAAVWFLLGNQNRQTEVSLNNNRNNKIVNIENSPAPKTFPTASPTAIPANDNPVNNNISSNLSSAEQSNLSNSTAATSNNTIDTAANKETLSTGQKVIDI